MSNIIYCSRKVFFYNYKKGVLIINKNKYIAHLICIKQLYIVQMSDKEAIYVLFHVDVLIHKTDVKPILN